VEVQREAKCLPYVPTEDEIRRYYQTVWTERRGSDVVLIKTLLSTRVRVAELVAIRLDEVDLDACRIRVIQGKGNKDRVVPFPTSFKETLGLHMDAMRHQGAAHLFESSWKKPYRTRGVRAMLTRYAKLAGIAHPISPHRLRHFLFTWPKASTTPSSSPTATTPVATPLRSTPRSPSPSPSPTPSRATTRQSTASPCRRPFYLAAGHSFGRTGPFWTASRATPMPRNRMVLGGAMRSNGSETDDTWSQQGRLDPERHA
jgi:integrase/recombinase XerD